MIEEFKEETVKNFRLVNGRIDSPTIYLANLYIGNEKHSWIGDNLARDDRVREAIEVVVQNEEFLSDINRGKYFIASPLGVVFYVFGNNVEFDSKLIRYKEFEFCMGFDNSVETKINTQSPLEDRLKVAEYEIWRDSKSISQYYEHPRYNASVNNYYPNKSF